MEESTGSYEKKRFIAGAVCSACAAMDTVFTYQKAGEQWRGCAQCGMRESYSAFAATQEELPTRVNRHRVGEPALAHETPTEAVVLVDISIPAAGRAKGGEDENKHQSKAQNQGPGKQET